MALKRLVVIWKIRRAQRLKDSEADDVFKELFKYVGETGELPSKDQISAAIMTSVEAGRAIDEYIAVLESDYWADLAQRYLLPTPHNDAYLRTKYFAQEYKRSFFYFNEETLAALRNSVRKEQKERSENFRAWASLAIGFVGALIGLTAMLKK
ncbi:hypothetical protein AB8B21_13790 [Tardiphaga sp. 866_E4_N2_1]|uniref:hypothetical protein n=1 Tax=unclassified Tardiphaga TaxID=2631404 RepID=UPI003F23004C